MWLITRTFILRHEIHPVILDRYLAPPAGWLAAILSFDAVIRLGEMTRWFALAYPVIFVLLYAATAGVLMMVWRLF